MNDKELVDEVLEFYRKYYREDIAKLAQRYPKEQRSLHVDYTDIARFSPEISDDLVQYPDEVLPLFEDALSQFDLPADIDLSNARVRVHNLDTYTKKVDELRDGDVERLRSISGQISKASAVRPKVIEAAWECQRCGSMTYIPIETELKQPAECHGCERQGPFSFDYHNSTVENHQLIRIKQPPEEATNSAQIGNKIDANIMGDLVGFAEAGERADVCGVLRVKTNENNPTLDFYFDAFDIDKRNDDFSDLDIDDHKDTIRDVVETTDIYPIVAESIAPGITGGRTVDIETPWGEKYDKYWWVRLGTAIANLFGSWRRPNGDGTFVRGSSHTLFIGDPSTGKSSIMNSIESISPRSASESGKNVSGAGLTAAAVRDNFGDSEWSLEAGALVKAHNGVAIIDEIDKMDKDGLSRLHSALEKQRLEINKAGIDATLVCETSLLAAGNPSDSRFNIYETDHSQIDIVSSLLDRFDLVFTFKDQPDRARDTRIANSVIEARSESGLVEKGELEREERTTANPRISVEQMRAWVALARRDVEPVIKSQEVKDRLQDFYVGIRAQNAEKSDSANEPVPATVRTLDGLLRLSEASARMRLSDEVEMIDAAMAIALVQVSLNDIGYDPESGKMDVDFANGRGSWTQKDRIKKIEGIVNNLAGENGAEYENVVETAVSAGIDKDKAYDTIEDLRTKGQLYEPQSGYLRAT